MTINLPLLLPTFEALPTIARSYVGQIPESELDVLRLADAWTVREHIYHLAGVQVMLLGRLELLQREKAPLITPYAPEKVPNRDKLFPSIEASLQHWSELRRQQVSLLRSLAPDAFDHEASHPEYRQYNIATVLHHMVFHEYWHLYRIEELWLAHQVERA